MCWCKNNYLVFIFVILCLCVQNYVNSYNIDTENVVRYHGRNSSMFGFTVAPHIEGPERMVLVGAPKAQTGRRDIIRGGAVYKCSASTGSCSQIPFDRREDPIYDKYEKKNIDEKSNQWFGASLYSSGANGAIVACAPRYVYFSTKHDRRDPVGTCYVARNNFANFSEYSPCRTWQWGYHRQGSCQAGFSSVISKDGERLFIGAPGNCYWQGRTFSIDAKADFPFTPPLFGPYGSGKVVRQSLASRPAVIQTQEGSAIDDDSYLGYSMAIGDFYGEGIQGVAAGMPRGGGLHGKVILYTWNLTSFRNITGPQMGCYFGYAVAAADIDGDTYDDIIIGAPLFTEPNNEKKYEVGRVYVVYQRSDGVNQARFVKIDQLDGFNSKSRFGLSLASLGDINLDGYGDFAVGAPYDGPQGRGAVYIFHGSKNGVISKHTQVIYAEDMVGKSPPYTYSEAPPTTFGFSLAGGVDLDGNDYPDTIVGAYATDTAFFLRSRPVVKVEGYAQFRTINKEIVLENKDCDARIDGVLTRVSCTSIETCLKYTGVGVPRDITLQLQYVLDTQKKKDPRMFFLEGDKNAWNGERRLLKDRPTECIEKVVYLTNDIRDKLTPLDVEVTYSMVARYQSDSRVPAPVLDVSSKSLKKDSISVRKNCGPDNVCIPDLVLDVKPNVVRYLLASNEVLVFDINVSNRGEDSFETTFAVQIPEDVYYNGIQDTGDVKISCGESINNHTISCNIGNPLPANKIANFKMFFKPHYKEGMKRFYVFNAHVNSTNPEDGETTNDNSVEIKLPIWVNSKLELKGTSRPPEVHYNYSYYEEMEQVKHEREIGPQVIHLYTITNNGPSRINEAEVLIFWPYATASGQDLMHILEAPHVLGNVTCQRGDFNYQGYQIAKRKKTIWETLGIDVNSATTISESSSFHDTGISIEEGTVKTGEKPKVHTTKQDEKYEKSTGDASFDHIERQQKISSQTDTQGRTVTTNSRYDNPGGETLTYKKNTTIIAGPDGRIINQTTYEEGDARAAAGFRQDGHDFSISGKHSGASGGSGEINVQEEYHRTHETHDIPYSSVEFDVTPPNLQSQGGQTHSGHRQGSQYSSESHYQQGVRQHGGQNQYQGGQNQYEGGQNHQQGGQNQNIGGQTQYQGGQNQYQGGKNQYQGGQNQYQGGRTQHQSGQSYQGGRSQEQGGHHQSGYHQSGQYGSSQGGSYGHVQNRTSESDQIQQSIGAGSFGHASKVGVVDLGVLDRNVDQSLSQQGGSIDQYSERREQVYDPDLGVIDYSTHKPRGVHKSRTYSAERSGQYGSSEDQNHHQSGGSRQESHSESHWSSSSGTGDNYNLNIGNDQYDDEGRRKRQIDEDFDLKSEVQCKTTKCKYVKCHIGPMLKDQDVTIALRARVNVNTLRSISKSNTITFSTMMVGKITNVPYIGIPSERETVKHEIVTNIVAPEPETQPDVVPLWVVVLSAVAGALILLLLIFLFYKCGFFKRNRPSNVPERQPLNRNGHYSSGDEAL